MDSFLNFIDGLGEILMIVTPLTFTIGIINAIKKTGKEEKLYKIIAIVSAYLIIIPCILNYN